MVDAVTVDAPNVPCHHGPHAPGVSCHQCNRGVCSCTTWTSLDLHQRRAQLDRGEHYAERGHTCTPWMPTDMPDGVEVYTSTAPGLAGVPVVRSIPPVGSALPAGQLVLFRRK